MLIDYFISGKTLELVVLTEKLHDCLPASPGVLLNIVLCNSVWP